MATLFSKIVSGEIPCYKVAESADYMAFLDVNPLKPGHTLVIPKKETNYIFDMSDSEFAGLHLFAKIVAGALIQVIPCKRIGVAVIGLEVPHAHIHLVPMNSVGDLSFDRERVKLTPEEFASIAEKIRAQLLAL